MGEAGWTLHPTETVVVEPKLYEIHYNVNNLWNSAPDGYRVPNGQGGTLDYTQGQYLRNGATEDTQGAELKTTWTAWAGHQLLAGATAERQRLYGVVNTVNVPGSGPGDMVDAGPLLTSTRNGTCARPTSRTSGPWPPRWRSPPACGWTTTTMPAPR